jgi:predicted acetyltransferase
VDNDSLVQINHQTRTNNEHMTIEYRSSTKQEWTAVGRAVARGFGNHPPTDQHSVEGWERFFEILHTACAWDSGEVVGTSGAFTRDTTVPGGAQLPTAMVTIVTVAATHRRQGVMTNMMRRVLQQAHERGEPIATLWASESVIYGRFGYGMAGQHYNATIGSARAHLSHMPEIPGSVRFVDRTELRNVGPDIWTRTAASRPGMPARTEGGWASAHPLPVDESNTDKKMFYAVYEENGRHEGYVAYKITKSGRDDDHDNIRVEELIATNDAAQAALYRFLLGIDLIHEINVPTMPQDDPLWWMLSDPRRLKRTAYDAIWLRLLDVERALSARTYAAECDIVLGVEDEFCPWVAGNYRLKVDASGNATCTRTDAAPGIVLPAASLSTCYFGNAKFADLARAGRVEEKTAGAIAAADRAFVSEREPWCPMHY